MRPPENDASGNGLRRGLSDSSSSSSSREREEREGDLGFLRRAGRGNAMRAL